MVYTFGNYEKKDIIKNYEKTDGNIKINYLDGTKYVLEDTESVEQKLINEMLEQAIQRNNDDSRIHTNGFKNINGDYMFPTRIEELEGILLKAVALGLISAGTFGLTFTLLYDGLSLKSGSAVPLAAIVLFLISIEKVSKSVMEYIDIKKYDIYLEIKEELEKYKSNPNLFNDISTKEININNIDNITYEEMQKLEDNLERCQKLEKVLN